MRLTLLSFFIKLLVNLWCKILRSCRLRCCNIIGIVWVAYFSLVFLLNNWIIRSITAIAWHFFFSSEIAPICLNWDFISNHRLSILHLLTKCNGLCIAIVLLGYKKSIAFSASFLLSLQKFEIEMSENTIITPGNGLHDFWAFIQLFSKVWE